MVDVFHRSTVDRLGYLPSRCSWIPLTNIMPSSITQVYFSEFYSLMPNFIFGGHNTIGIHFAILDIFGELF